ncbi:hypothetical protein KUTeg_014900 [Tegillarca granosa]|uniref:Uncharacterized protein n=1 Tax=Tegillarca granosa TaxID=220873 RepID=A0ABQ9ENI1_TEGGR|nr:hypothetical protein KUTeg_014900 [Tegillarca granosa]
MTTTQPRNSSEWQLYRVLQRANLLQYYDTFIAQGGDDVQQLCEAGEEEFLEIMALVGMASKPLHVRRLQKALQEWVSNPAGFQSAAPPSSLLGTPTISSPGSAIPAVSHAPVNMPPSQLTPLRDPSQSLQAYTTNSAPTNSSSIWSSNTHPQLSHSPGLANTPGSSSGGSAQGELKDTLANSDPNNYYHGQDKDLSGSPGPTPVLVESQINAIAEAAAKLSKELPPFEPKGLSLKKQINREILILMQATDDDPNRMEELRKYAAIYGRFDSKRKNTKPMSQHEISVNEAAAQLCRHIPSLLTRREDLFPLARQVVKNSGYQYSKGHSRAAELTVLPSAKRPRFDMMLYQQLYENQKNMKFEIDKLKKDEKLSASLQEKLTTINEELTSVALKLDEYKTHISAAKEKGDEELCKSLQTELELVSSRQLQLISEQNEILRKQRSELQSGGSSPYPDNSGDGENFPGFKSFLAAQAKGGGKYMQDTLFDEGLRIAQQYGMADFANEIKEMQFIKPGDENESNGGDAEEEKGPNTNGVQNDNDRSSPEFDTNEKYSQDMKSDRFTPPPVLEQENHYKSPPNLEECADVNKFAENAMNKLASINGIQDIKQEPVEELETCQNNTEVINTCFFSIVLFRKKQQQKLEKHNANWLIFNTTPESRDTEFFFHIFYVIYVSCEMFKGLGGNIVIVGFEIIWFDDFFFF